MSVDCRDDLDDWVDLDSWHDTPDEVPSYKWISQNLSVNHPEAVRTEGWRRLLRKENLADTYQSLCVLREKTRASVDEALDPATAKRRQGYLDRVERAIREVGFHAKARGQNPFTVAEDLIAAVEHHKPATVDDQGVDPEPADLALWSLANEAKDRLNRWQQGENK